MSIIKMSFISFTFKSIFFLPSTLIILFKLFSQDEFITTIIENKETIKIYWDINSF